MNHKPEYAGVKRRLDAVSPSFCLAKWLQVTIHLHNGQTHSCHHPNTHPVPLEELAQNPSALHNTRFKKLQRKRMLEGERPPECEYCWNIEDIPGNHFSDRTIKSSDDWALPELEKISQQPFDLDVNPRYLEVSFSNACNFKCSYCYPHFSSRWMSEIKELGPYQPQYIPHLLEHLQGQGKIPYEHEGTNPYVEAFWKWWPSLYPDLKVLRITGGEPLLSPSTFRLLDEVIAKPNPSLEIAINSNLGASPAVINRFLEKIDYISRNRLLKRVRLYTSLDSWGAQAEYIRYGLDFKAFWENLERIVRDLPQVDTTVMCTFSKLSVPGYLNLLKGFLELKRKHRTFENQHSFLIDIAYLMNPQHQSVILLPRAYLNLKLGECARFIEANMADGTTRTVGFSEYERVKFLRVQEFALSARSDKQDVLLSNFFRFFSEHDRRRKTNLLATFPELSYFWESCREADERVKAGSV